jgi:hypothetical protein
MSFVCEFDEIHNKMNLSELNAILCSQHEVNEHSVEVMPVFSQVSFLKLFSVRHNGATNHYLSWAVLTAT